MDLDDRRSPGLVAREAARGDPRVAPGGARHLATDGLPRRRPVAIPPRAEAGGTRLANDIITIGGCCIDHLSIVTRTADGWEACGTPLVQGGGPAATGAVAIARLGGSVELWSYVGDDYHGQMIRGELERQGVDVSKVHVAPNHHSPSSYIEVDSRPASGRSTARASTGGRRTSPPTSTRVAPARRRRCSSRSSCRALRSRRRSGCTRRGARSSRTCSG